jgi:hypothetical protein
VEPLWPAFEIAIFILNIVLFWTAWRYALQNEKRFIVYLLLAIFITISMVILARPDHSIVPDFDYRYAGPPYYFYCLFLALAVSMATRAKKEHTARIIVSILVVILAMQQIFSFHGVRLQSEAKMRQGAIVMLYDSLLPELETLSKKNPLVIPNLTGAHIFQGMPGYTLADYLLFFNKKMPVKLAQNAHMPPDVKTNTVETVESVRTSTSQKFKDALKKSSAIRSYYTSSVWMRYKNIDNEQVSLQTLPLSESREIFIQRNEFNPEKFNTVLFSFYTDDIPGNLEFSFSFKNDFGVDREAGSIRVDDYTPYTLKDSKRLYRIETNLLQLYAYSLSEKISNLTLYVPETKGAFVSGIYFK